LLLPPRYLANARHQGSALFVSRDSNITSGKLNATSLHAPPRGAGPRGVGRHVDLT
jgi:hypothetical protein